MTYADKTVNLADIVTDTALQRSLIREVVTLEFTPSDKESLETDGVAVLTGTLVMITSVEQGLILNFENSVQPFELTHKELTDGEVIGTLTFQDWEA